MMSKKNTLLASVIFIVLALVLFRHTPEDEEALNLPAKPAAVAYTPVENPVETPRLKQPAINPVDISKAVVAQATHNLRFPEHSLPLSEDQYDLLNPNSQSPIERPYDVNSISGSVRITTEYFRYGTGQSINGSVNILAENDFLDLIESVNLVLENLSQNTISTQSLNITSNEQAFIVSTDDIDKGEYLVALKIQLFGGESIYQSVPIQVVDYIAEFKGVEQAYIEGDEVHIETNIDFKQEGFHRIRANLFDATGQPVAHLQDKVFTQHNKTPTFRVSGALLFEKQASPPYSLRNVQVEYISADPKKSPEFGQASSEEFPVDIDLDLEIFSEVKPTLSDTNLTRIKFLQSISQ